MQGRSQRLYQVCAIVVKSNKDRVSCVKGPYDVEAQASWLPPGYRPDMVHSYILDPEHSVIKGMHCTSKIH